MADPVAAFREVEGRFLAEHGLSATERWLDLPAPRARVRVLDVGEGPPTLHVHGGGAWGSIAAPLVAALPGRRHLLLDRPGFGLSERADLGPSFGDDAVALLTSVLDGLGLEAVDLVANSIGATIATWFAVAHPERVRSLSFVGFPANLGEGSAPFAFRLLGVPVIGPLMLAMEPPSERQARTLLRRFGHDGLPAIVYELTAAAERVPAYAPAWRELLAATVGLRGIAPGVTVPWEAVRALRCPVAFAWGRGEPMGEERHGRALAAALGDAPFTIAGIGHLPWLDDAGAVACAIEPVLASTAVGIARYGG